MNRRLISALVAALFVSGACTLLLGRKITGSARGHVAQRQYVAASRLIAAGQVIKTEDLKKIDWPANIQLQGGFMKPEDLTGRAALYPIEAGQPIIDKDLATAGTGLGITTRIPDGMRALALRSDDIVGVGGFVFPGSFVDVLVTYRTPGNPDPVTVTVLQDAEVLAAGHQTQPDPDGKPSTVGEVTLLLAPADAQRVVLASTLGSIHFVLRNGADRKQVTEAPTLVAQFGGAPSKPASGSAHPWHPHADRPHPYVVQTILGDKSVEATF